MSYVQLHVKSENVTEARAEYGKKIWGNDTPDPADFGRVYVSADSNDVIHATVTRLDQDQTDWLPGLSDIFECQVTSCASHEDAVADFTARMAKRGYRPRE